jgi:hypothetical protein
MPDEVASSKATLELFDHIGFKGLQAGEGQSANPRHY